MVEPYSVPQSGPCHTPQRALPPLHGCSTWASSYSLTCTWCHSLFARHYFYQNFREVLSHSSLGIYLGLLMSQQHWPCQALPAREDKRALPPHGDHSSPPARLGTPGWLSSWGLLVPAQAGGARRCTVGPMVVVVSTGRPWDGGRHRALVPAKGPGDTSGEGASCIPPFRNWRVLSSAPGFSLPQLVPKPQESGEQPTEI